MEKEIKKNDELFKEGIKDFTSKIPDNLESYDYWFRFAQLIIQISDNSEQVKNISNIIANSFVKALDANNKK